MHNWSSEGIVLKRRDFGEADKLLTIFSKQRGKVKVLAKGVRRINSKRSGNVELLNHSKLFFAESKIFPLLTEAETINAFPSLKEDLVKIGFAYQITELIDNLFHEEQESRVTFEFLTTTLRNIDLAEDQREARLYKQEFEVKILELAGFRPQFFTCPKCREPLSEQTHLLSPELGGVVNRSCVNDLVLTKPISSLAIKMLRFLQEEDSERVGRVQTGESLQKEVDQALAFYLEYILEKSLRSTEFLEKVERL